MKWSSIWRCRVSATWLQDIRRMKRAVWRAWISGEWVLSRRTAEVREEQIASKPCCRMFAMHCAVSLAIQDLSSRCQERLRSVSA